MKNRRTAFVFIIAAIFVLVAAVYAAEPVRELKETVTPTPADRPGQKAEGGSDIMLLIDSSGSMKKTDPKDYRKDSARLFISLLSPDDSVGIISFGDGAKTLIPLTKNSARGRAALFGAAKKITSREYSTDITGAIKKGVAELAESKRTSRIIVLMSDGKLALGDPKQDEASTAELMKLLPEISKAGIRIYAIAFSELSDPKLLGALAEKTGGLFRYAKTDKDIHIMFASIFEKIKSPDSVALQGDSFAIDRDVKEAVLLITKKEGTATVLIDPSGRKSTKKRAAKNIRWFGSAVFDMITINTPQTGKWKVSLSGKEGNRIYVLTDLKLKTSFSAATLKKGDKVVIDAWLEKDDRKITESAVLGQVMFSAEVEAPDGSRVVVPLAAKPAPDAGVYAAEVSVGQTGDYSLKLSAAGKTFNRTKELHFNSVEPPPAAKLTTPAAVTAPRIKEQFDRQKILMVSAVINAVLLIIIVLLLFAVRKYRRLCRRALAEAAARPVDSYAPQAPEEKKALPEEEERADMAGAGQPADQSREGVRISKLLKVIDFQKAKIAELMKITETLGSLREKIGGLPARSRLQHDSLKTLSEERGMIEEAAKPLAALEDDMGELVSYVLLLEKEETDLAGKFKEWEADLRRLMEGEELPVSQTEVLAARLKEAEVQLKAGEQQIDGLKKQLEGLDKEYMTLYHQQQAQEKAQQAVEEAQKQQGTT